jgi:two-component system chemotaxis response regulator CheY
MEQTKYFKSVRALSAYQLEILTETDTFIIFDFSSRFNTARFGALRDESLFKSVTTDGDYLLFEHAGHPKVKITAQEMMDLVLLDRTRIG